MFTTTQVEQKALEVLYDLINFSRMNSTNDLNQTKKPKKLRVKVHTQSRIDSIHQHEAILTNGTKINFDFMIFAGGTTTAPCLSDLGFEKTPKGQFVVDAYLRVKEDSSIYIVGDTAALNDKKGNPLPPLPHKLQ